MGKERGVREKLERTLSELRANSRRTQGEGRANVEKRKSEGGGEMCNTENAWQYSRSRAGEGNV